ncbi:MAG: bifunctional UDP-N-acetylglucosamine diphosphorylase/glucosamine-1-phosphate N-acetyltransferase GlmU [Coriobacteriia bacterium]|jgi:bifunctional UDP-N-acetylglucosamine pyrophosphorylase/glucosamine-1-phosphate N-acetyltransferase|nr:bifunctional UDP-N-acetylglucosamine diphosphorylase/glucosamine-1-phosphate N-acetyltransferase GlmU [Coriobacteriia bacterium]
MGATALILAAGEGTRMRSDLPKVAHTVLGTPMVIYVAEAARAAGCHRVVAVTGHGAEMVEGLLDDVRCVRQDRQLGTGHAVMCARDAVEAQGSLVVLSGDCPLMRPETIAALISAQQESSAALAILTARVDDPTGYGRIIREGAGTISAIVEQKDCTPEQCAISEVNTGTYCFDAAALFEHLDRLSTDNAQGEFYLTDMVSIFVAEGLAVHAVLTDDAAQTMGVNSRVQLAEATRVMQERINTQHMLKGVTMTDPSLVWIGPKVEIGRDTEVLPMTFLMGETKIGSRTVLGPNTRVTDSLIGDDAVVDASVVVKAEIRSGANVGPVAYLRPGAILEPRAKAGTCVEIKNSTIGQDSKVPHLSYIGDALIGSGVNVGAGTITCNYDGSAKHATVIEDGAFIGSDTMLVAPVTIGAGAMTAAASAIAHDVAPGSLAIERSEQREIAGWVARRREAHAKSAKQVRRSEGER